MTDTADPNHITRAELADLIGCGPSYINDLEKQGRAYRAPGGKLWLKAESLAAFRATRDPARQGVADHHTAKRGAPTLGALPAPPSPPVTDAMAAPDAPFTTAALYDFQTAKAKREYYAAEREHTLYRKEAGELMERGDVVAAFAEAAAILRSSLESWSQTLPPVLSNRDEASMRSALAEEVERILRDLNARFTRLAGDAA